MAMVELSIHARNFSVIKGSAEKGRSLVLGALEPFVEHGRRGNSSIRAGEDNIGIESVAASAHSRVPAGITERLEENTVSTADDCFRVHRVSEASPGGEFL